MLPPLHRVQMLKRSENLATFDTLDFNVFSHRDWSRFHESHDKNIKVHFPDGHTTEGLDVHIQDMEAMFVYAPDTRITAHPIKIGTGNITAVTGIYGGHIYKADAIRKWEIYTTNRESL